ncbi:hypothetical protein PG989_001737 [Apiospora arundinis]
MGGKHSGKDASSSSKKSKSKSKASGSSSTREPSWSDRCLQDDQPHERVAQGLPSGRGDSAAALAQWNAQWAAASNKR